MVLEEIKQKRIRKSANTMTGVVITLLIVMGIYFGGYLYIVENVQSANITLDSKYADPTGTPGDGDDIFALVEDYGAGDDHAATNVPLLIEKLAKYFKTCSKGTTYISDMQDGIDQWFIDTGLDDFFQEITYNKPEFDFIEEEIERSQDVLLLVGYYNRPKVVDQEQTIWTSYIDLPGIMPGHLQEFVPTVEVLDAVQILLAANNPGVDTDIKVCIWDVLPNPNANPLGCSVMTISPPPINEPEWFQFHFYLQNITISACCLQTIKICI